MEPIAFMITSLALLVTPGPTNTLLATAGAGRGVRGSAPLLAAELGGYLIAFILLRAVLGPVIAGHPGIEALLRLLAAAYLIHTALKLWSRGDMRPERHGPITFERVFTTTVLNPKAIIFAFTIVPQGLDWITLLSWLAVLASMIVVIGSLWIVAGACLRHGLRDIVSPSIGYRMSALALFIFAGALSAQLFI